VYNRPILFEKVTDWSASSLFSDDWSSLAAVVVSFASC